MKLKSALFVILLLLFTAAVCSAESTSSDSQGAYTEGEIAFRALIDDLVNQNVIPAGGTYSYRNDYTNEWAQIDWSQWTLFDDSFKNFVFSANVSWASAHERPNTAVAGCGIIFRETDIDNMLAVSLNMDGCAYLQGKRLGKPLSYSYYRYSAPQIKATHQFVVIANGPVVTVYVDGVQAGRWSSVAITDEGRIGMVTMSGTNRGFGTRCEWQDIFYYYWE